MGGVNTKLTELLTFNIIGNCPKWNFSLITAPPPYWKQTSSKNFPSYDILACLHCPSRIHTIYKSMPPHKVMPINIGKTHILTSKGYRASRIVLELRSFWGGYNSEFPNQSMISQEPNMMNKLKNRHSYLKQN